MTQQSLVDQDLLIIEASRLHTTRSAGLLNTRDRPVAETSTHNIHNRRTSMHPAVFEPTIPASEPQQDPRLRPHWHWDQPLWRTVLRFAWLSDRPVWDVLPILIT